MSWLTGLSDALQGLPLNAVLRERVALAEQRFKALEEENAMLKAQVGSLTVENASLKQQLAGMQQEPQMERGCYIFNSDKTKLYCVRCYHNGKKVQMADNQGLGLKCAVCKNHIANPVTARQMTNRNPLRP